VSVAFHLVLALVFAFDLEGRCVRCGDQRDLQPVGVLTAVSGEGLLLVGKDLAADAQLDGDRVGVLAVVTALVPVVVPGLALGTDGGEVCLVGEGFLPVACRPGAVPGAPELGVRDAPPVAQSELVAEGFIGDQPFPRSMRSSRCTPNAVSRSFVASAVAQSSRNVWASSSVIPSRDDAAIRTGARVSRLKS